MRRANEGGYDVLGTASFTQMDMRDLSALAQSTESMTINKVGANYEILSGNKRTTIAQAKMAVLLASSGRTLGEFDKMSQSEKVSLFQQSSMQTMALEQNAPISEQALTAAKPKKKKNFLEQILDYVKTILNVFMLWSALNRVLELIGITKKNKSSSDAESEARSLYYTMNTLNSSYNNLERDLERMRK
jgi:hypothetical protein